VAYDQVREMMGRWAGCWKRLYDTKVSERKFPLYSWVLRYYPPAAKNKLGSPWIGPFFIVRKAQGHTVGIQKTREALIVFVHIDDIKLCSIPEAGAWSVTHTTKSALFASTLAPMSTHASLSDSDGNITDSTIGIG
jgi:hypothetical protein